MDFLWGRLSQRVSLEVSSGVCRGQGLQIQDRAVIQGVVGGVRVTGLSSHRVSLTWCV